MFSQGNSKLILLAIEDFTDRHAAERQMTELLQQKETLLQEMQHRVANSLQKIASVGMFKARTVESAETRRHLQDAHVRVMSVATVQQQLQASHGGPIKFGPYLSRLCDALAVSMVGGSRPIVLKVEADPGAGVSAEAMSIGLIATELVINALKHAFPDSSGGEILVRYEADGPDWRLSISVDGVGAQQDGGRRRTYQLGATIVGSAWRIDLNARVEKSQPITEHGNIDRPHRLTIM